jgi:proteasome lid subunit RPN8/RPN11
MMLTIDPSMVDAMIAAARRVTPLEACGLLGGTDGQATAFYELTNADASGEHYTMLPQEQFEAIKDMRTKGARMLAIWHSHPETPARMSEEDLRLAYTPDVIYLIVSLADPDRPDLQGYVVEDGVPAAVEVAIHTDDAQ